MLWLVLFYYSRTGLCKEIKSSLALEDWSWCKGQWSCVIGTESCKKCRIRQKNFNVCEAWGHHSLQFGGADCSSVRDKWSWPWKLIFSVKPMPHKFLVSVVEQTSTQSTMTVRMTMNNDATWANIQVRVRKIHYVQREDFLERWQRGWHELERSSL